MGDVLFTAALWVLGLICLGTLLFMVLILIAFIVGECQRHSRTRMRHRVRAAAYERARREAERRERRLAKEKSARDAWAEEENLRFQQIQEMFDA